MQQLCPLTVCLRGTCDGRGTSVSSLATSGWTAGHIWACAQWCLCDASVCSRLRINVCVFSTFWMMVFKCADWRRFIYLFNLFIFFLKFFGPVPTWMGCFVFVSVAQYCCQYSSHIYLFFKITESFFYIGSILKKNRTYSETWKTVACSLNPKLQYRLYKNKKSIKIVMKGLGIESINAVYPLTPQANI